MPGSSVKKKMRPDRRRPARRRRMAEGYTSRYRLRLPLALPPIGRHKHPRTSGAHTCQADDRREALADKQRDQAPGPTSPGLLIAIKARFALTSLTAEKIHLIYCFQVDTIKL